MGIFESCSLFKIDFATGAAKVSSSPKVTGKEDTTKTDDTKKTDTSGTTAPTQPAAKSPFPVLGILAGLGAAAVLLRRRLSCTLFAGKQCLSGCS